MNYHQLQRTINRGELAAIPTNGRIIVWDDVKDIPVYQWPIGLYMICPKMAEILLKTNLSNRKIKDRHIQKLVDQLENDEWEFQGSTIVIFMNGILGDGQHRLKSVVKTGKSIVTMVVTGVDPRVFTKIDTIQKLRDRSTSIEHLTEVKYAQPTSAACAWVWNYAMGQKVLSGSRRELAADNTRVYLIGVNHPGLIDLFNYIHPKNTAKSLYSPGLAAVGYMASLIDETKAAAFIEGVLTGAMMEETDPRLRLRNHLMAQVGKSDTLGRFNSMILAWNAFYEGRKPRSVKWTTTNRGNKSVVYPTISGFDKSMIFNEIERELLEDLSLDDEAIAV